MWYKELCMVENSCNSHTPKKYDLSTTYLQTLCPLLNYMVQKLTLHHPTTVPELRMKCKNLHKRQSHLKTALIHQPNPGSCFQTCLHSDKQGETTCWGQRRRQVVCMGALSYIPLNDCVWVTVHTVLPVCERVYGHSCVRLCICECPQLDSFLIGRLWSCGSGRWVLQGLVQPLTAISVTWLSSAVFHRCGSVGVSCVYTLISLRCPLWTKRRGEGGGTSELYALLQSQLFIHKFFLFFPRWISKMFQSQALNTCITKMWSSVVILWINNINLLLFFALLLY